MTRQEGFSYLEALIAVAIVAVSLVPALRALETSVAGTGIHEELATTRYAELALMEAVLAEPYASLLSASAAQGPGQPTSYSDAAGTVPRRPVRIELYDAGDADGDGDPFTVPDPDADGDGDPYTGYDGVLWVQVIGEDAPAGIETLTSP